MEDKEDDKKQSSDGSSSGSEANLESHKFVNDICPESKS